MFDDIYISHETDEVTFDGHVGYLNFWPFFLNILEPNDARFKKSFDKLVAEDSALLTDFGVRSLSKNDPYYK